jgi:hypothetical protein
MRGDGWVVDGDGDDVSESSEFAGTAGIATAIVIMMVALLLLHALA